MIRRGLVAGAVLVLAVGGFAGCSDDGDGGGDGRRPAGAAPSGQPSGSSPEVLAKQYLRTEDVRPAGSSEANLELDSGSGRVVADVLEVRAGPTSTKLRWQLRTPETTGSLPGGIFSRSSTDPFVSAVAITPTGTQQRLLPGVYNHGTFYTCTCPRQPYELGAEGVEMSSLYPALDADVQQVQVHIPKFPPITVPVTRE